MNQPARFFCLVCLIFIAPWVSAFESVVFVPSEPLPLTPLNPIHFDDSTSWAPEAFADFNGDQLPDLLSASFADNSVELFYRIRNGGFEPGKFIVQGTNTPNSLATGDWNLDGLADFAAGFNGGETIIALNQGNATFTIINGQYGSQVAAGDINNDGQADLITMSDGKLWRRFSTAAEWSDGSWLNAPSLVNPIALRLADFNGDGFLDAGAVAQYSDYFIHFGNGAGSFLPAIKSVNDLRISIDTLVNIADINADGKDDLIGFSIRGGGIENSDEGNLEILVSKGNGQFEEESSFDFPWIYHSDYYAVSDYNADGFDDIAATLRGESGNGSRIRIMYGPYDNGFQWIDDLYVNDARPLGIYAINTLPSGAADLMVIFNEPSHAVYFRWTGLQPTTQNREATTLRVPEDVLTLSQALRESIDGDVISLAQAGYDDNILINNATVTISGRLNQGLPLITGVWDINDSNINIDLIETRETTITADNSALNLSRSKLSGVSSLREFYRADSLVRTSRPALVVQNASASNLSLTFCEIRGGDILEYPGELNINYDTSSGNFIHIPGAAMLVDSCTNIQTELNNTRIEGGVGVSYGSRLYATMQGGAGLVIRDSIGVIVENDNTFYTGGIGSDILVEYINTTSIFAVDAKRGGAGVKAIRSTLDFQGGRIDGGLAGDGGAFAESILENAATVIIDGATGGAGVQAFDHSYVTIRESVLNGGPGGVPNGENGPRIEFDETSTIELINTTKIRNWFLY